ncbi:hypothetical protein ACEQPO_21535 [Bacillus sp. SL00103]
MSLHPVFTDYTDEPLVSTDFNTNPYSAVIDGLTTMVMGDRKVKKFFTWYDDNEWVIHAE